MRLLSDPILPASVSWSKSTRRNPVRRRAGFGRLRAHRPCLRARVAWELFREFLVGEFMEHMNAGSRAPPNKFKQLRDEEEDKLSPDCDPIQVWPQASCALALVVLRNRSEDDSSRQASRGGRHGLCASRL